MCSPSGAQGIQAYVPVLPKAVHIRTESDTLMSFGGRKALLVSLHRHKHRNRLGVPEALGLLLALAITVLGLLWMASVAQSPWEQTGGSVVRAADLTDLAADLADREAPITDEELVPLWHRWWFFLIALACLCAEWGVRRFHGLP